MKPVTDNKDKKKIHKMALVIDSASCSMNAIISFWEHKLLYRVLEGFFILLKKIFFFSVF